ncbi:unnamed protein product [Ilex paraguariensis]|uniref:Uncharacterized protein n=1 Tax=Ilex paraguariensis TaxID=185542 RepID=A0ABC8SYM1_9AQUA
MLVPEFYATVVKEDGFYTNVQGKRIFVKIRKILEFRNVRAEVNPEYPTIVPLELDVVNKKSQTQSARRVLVEAAGQDEVNVEGEDDAQHGDNQPAYEKPGARSEREIILGMDQDYEILRIGWVITKIIRRRYFVF